MEYPQNTIATRNHSEKVGRNNSMLTVIKSIVLLFLLFCGVNLAVAENTIEHYPYDIIANPTPEYLPTYSGTCEDLHPVTDFNDLLTQIYRHIDDDCLYLMSTDALSKKLGIEVYAFFNVETGKFEESKYRYEELLEKPFTGFRSAVFMEKQTFRKEKYIEKLTLRQQNRLRTKGVRRVGIIKYKIIFSRAYLDNLHSPFYDRVPTEIPIPDESYDMNGLCASLDKNSLYNRGDNYSWLMPYKGYHWNGYIGQLGFFNCYTGANNFFVLKPFFKLKE